jgi:hypothetical protein
MNEILIRQHLLAKVNGRPINEDDYADAYRFVTKQEPPAGWKGMYAPRADAQGNWRFLLDRRSRRCRGNGPSRPIGPFAKAGSTTSRPIT